MGGPGTGFSGILRMGTTNRVAIRPIGLKVGPVRTLATKPYTRKSNSQGSPVKIVANAKANTMPATDLAATSFTGLGKLRIDFIEIWLIANYRAILINHYATTFLKPPYSHRHLSNLPLLGLDGTPEGFNSIRSIDVTGVCGSCQNPSNLLLSLVYPVGHPLSNHDGCAIGVGADAVGHYGSISHLQVLQPLYVTVLIDHRHWV